MECNIKERVEVILQWIKGGSFCPNIFLTYPLWYLFPHMNVSRISDYFPMNSCGLSIISVFDMGASLKHKAAFKEKGLSVEWHHSREKSLRMAHRKQLSQNSVSLLVPVDKELSFLIGRGAYILFYTLQSLQLETHSGYFRNFLPKCIWCRAFQTTWIHLPTGKHSKGIAWVPSCLSSRGESS